MSVRKVGQSAKVYGNRGKGRKKGTPNKVTTSVKEALEAAFEQMGGVPALVAWGTDPENRGEFYKLWGKLAPKPVEVSGDPDKPLVVRIVRG